MVSATMWMDEEGRGKWGAGTGDAGLPVLPFLSCRGSAGVALEGVVVVP